MEAATWMVRWIGSDGNCQCCCTHFIVWKTANINRFENWFQWVEIYCFVQNTQNIKVQTIASNQDSRGGNSSWCVLCMYERTYVRVCVCACIFDFKSLRSWVTRIIKKYAAYVKVTNKYNKHNQFEFYALRKSCSANKMREWRKKHNDEEEAEEKKRRHSYTLTHIGDR